MYDNSEVPVDSETNSGADVEFEVVTDSEMETVSLLVDVTESSLTIEFSNNDTLATVSELTELRLATPLTDIESEILNELNSETADSDVDIDSETDSLVETE